MPEQALGRPLDEADFRDDGWLYPPHRLHVFGGDPLTPTTLTRAVRQVDEGASRDWMIGNAPHDFGAHVRRKAGTDPAGEEKSPLVEIAHEERIEVRGARSVAPDDELLARAELHLHPGIRSVA